MGKGPRKLDAEHDEGRMSLLRSPLRARDLLSPLTRSDLRQTEEQRLALSRDDSLASASRCQRRHLLTLQESLFRPITI